MTHLARNRNTKGSIATRASAFVRRKLRASYIYRKLSTDPLGTRILKDFVFRAQLTLFGSIPVNLFFSTFHFLSSMIYNSIWLGALAVYDVMLAAIRFPLINHVAKSRPGQNLVSELRQYRLCGISLVVMTPVFVWIMILIVQKNSRAEYSGLLIIFAAIYAFIKIVLAIHNAIKFKKVGSPVMSAAKKVSLVSALVSILMLETAILFRYGKTQSPIFYQGMLGTICGSICVFVLGSAISMIVSSSKKLKKFEAVE